MYSIQLPVTIKNADLTSPVYNFHSYTSKEQFNRTILKSFIAKQINEYSAKNTSSVAASVFFNNSTLKIKHKVLQHIRDFTFGNTFNGIMKLHFYFKKPDNYSKNVDIVINGVSFINTLGRTVYSRNHSLITDATIHLDEICNSYTNMAMNGDFWAITFMKIHINTQSLFYMPTQQKVADFALSVSYLQKMAVILYFEDGTHLVLDIANMKQLLDLLAVV